MIGNCRNARIFWLKRERLDKLVHERGLVESLDLARRYIMAGQVRVGGARMDKPGAMVDPAACVEVVEGRRFVSRGGLKLAGALSGMGLVVDGLVCADVGASTGGFTDCLLQRGAVRVYAVDVGKGLLHWKLRNDARVVVVEETNARFLDALPEVVDLIVVDAAFISLQLLLPVVAGWLNPVGGRMLALVKPQFEAERSQVERGGVVRDAAVHRQVLLAAAAFAVTAGYGATQVKASGLRGPAGNREFFALFERGVGAADIALQIELAVASASAQSSPTHQANETQPGDVSPASDAG